MAFAFSETVTLHTKTRNGRDVRGNDAFTDTTTSVGGAVFDPGGTTEVTTAGDQVTQSPRFIWVGDCPSLTALDKIQRLDGSQWEVTGNPLRFRSPFNGQQVLQVNVRQVSG